MLTGIIFFVGFLLIFLFGYKLSRILLPGTEKLEQISLGYILGIGIFTFIWFLLNWAGIPYNLISGFVLLLSLNIILFVVDRVICKTKKWKPIVNLSYFKKLNTIEKFLLGIVIFLCVSALAQGIYWPIRYWDSLVLYDFRAKVFAETGFMQAAISRGYFFGYPLLTSLAHTWVYLLGGTNPSFLYALLYISLLISFFLNLKKLNIGRTTAIFLTAVVAVSPRLFDHTQWAYTNLPYSIYIILGSIYLYFGIKKKHFGAYVVSALLIGLSTWTRSAEPFWLSCVIGAIIFSLILRKWLWPIIYLGLFLPIMIPWRMFQEAYQEGTAKITTQIVSTAYGLVNHISFSSIVATMDFVTRYVFEQYLIFFVIFVVALILKLIMKSKNWLFLIIIVLDIGLTFLGTLSFVKYISYWHEIPDSLTRMVMFFPPMVIFLIAEILSGNSRFFNKNK
jgi:hypothetical protein